jgi:hypothetical protein
VRPAAPASADAQAQDRPLPRRSVRSGFSARLATGLAVAVIVIVIGLRRQIFAPVRLRDACV